jgi:hypothetical protein
MRGWERKGIRVWDGGGGLEECEGRKGGGRLGNHPYNLPTHKFTVANSYPHSTADAPSQ